MFFRWPLFQSKGCGVFTDLQGATEAKTHKACCETYLNRKRDASTAKWSDVYPGLAEAAQTAGVNRKARCSFD